jgi:hypothetical protein
VKNKSGFAKKNNNNKINKIRQKKERKKPSDCKQTKNKRGVD